jgi:hypothetical protein
MQDAHSETDISPWPMLRAGKRNKQNSWIRQMQDAINFHWATWFLANC